MAVFVLALLLAVSVQGLTAQIMYPSVIQARVKMLPDEKALPVAARNGEWPRVKKFLQRAGPESAALVNAFDRENRTALFYAVAEGNREMVAYLIREGARPNASNVEPPAHLEVQWAVFLEAARVGDSEIDECLVSQGDWPPLTIQDARRLQRHAERYGHPAQGARWLQRIRQALARQDLLRCIVDREMLLIMANEDPQVMEGTYKGRVPFFEVLEFGAAELGPARHMVKCGVNLETRDHLGRTALLYALDRSLETGVIAFLLKAGADPFAVDAWGRSSDYYVSRLKHPVQREAVEALLDAAAIGMPRSPLLGDARN